MLNGGKRKSIKKEYTFILVNSAHNIGRKYQVRELKRKLKGAKQGIISKRKN